MRDTLQVTGPVRSAHGVRAFATRHAVTGTPLERLLSNRRNSFGFLRWVFAALVVVDHTYPIGGFRQGEDPLWAWSRGQESFGGVAVAGFFVISGFLITRSWAGCRSAVRYLWHRFLRIFPGFWVCLVVTAFLFAPLAWHHEFGGFTGLFTAGPDGPFAYVGRNFFLTMRQYGISGLLRDTPFGRLSGGAWNGSLWTLIYEFRCYLLVAAFGLTGLLARYRILVVAFTVALYLATVSWVVDPTWAAKLVPLLSDLYVARFTMLFFLGALMALYASKLVIDDRLGLAAALIAAVTLHEGGWVAVGYPVFAYAVVWLAFRLPFARFDRPGDFSYGTYIYAFPLQMMLADRGFQSHGPLLFLVTSLLLATLAAITSWHLVEKRALRWKNWTPRLMGARGTGAPRGLG